MKKNNKIARFEPAHRELIASLNEKIGHDGHTIWEPSVLESFPVALQERFIEDHSSDGTVKGSITDNSGAMVEELKGVYGLDVLRAIVQDLGLKAESKFGRGFQATAYSRSIEDWLAKNPRN